LTIDKVPQDLRSIDFTVDLPAIYRGTRLAKS
jgi:hypothetical protein